MGEISSKIRVQLLNAKKLKVIDFKMLKEMESISAEREQRDKKLEEDHKDQDLLFKAYSWMIGLLNDLAEDFSPLSEFDPFYDIIEKKAEEYMPSGPPWSPLTKSYWNYWVWFDLKYGRDRETISTILLDQIDIIPYPDDFATLLKLASSSRMGVYAHLGEENGKIHLQELITNKEHTAISPAGYNGKKGELWFARLFLSPVESGYAMVATTPYILIMQDKADWLEFFDRNAISDEEEMADFMKYGTKKKRYYWHDFIMDAYADDEDSHIYLAGIPDIPQSLPQNPKSNLKTYRLREDHSSASPNY